MAASNTAWGIEIGQFAIKAIQLERVGTEVRVRDYFYRKHRHVLSEPGLTEITASGMSKAALYLEQTLGQFAAEKQLAGQQIIINFNWNQNRGFARFAKLPPMPPKEVPNIVKFEAGQQIPFPLEDVEWDYHAFEAEDSPEVEVGIFAIQQEPLKEFLTFITEKLGIEPLAVTLSPIALYNAMAYDRDIAGSIDPTVLLDIGTTSTDLVVAHGTKCWMRSFPLGGHDFTEAIASKLARADFPNPYEWGEEQKREFATSKHQKAIMQAMKPVIDDLIGDVQKSLQHYETQNRGTKIKNVILLGSTAKIPGLRVILGTHVNLDVKRLDQFSKIGVEGADASEFATNVVNYGVAYGLALQGLGMAAIDVNLMPISNVRQRLWGRKTRWFAAAAAVACAAGGAMFVQHLRANSALMSQATLQEAESAISMTKVNLEAGAAVGALSKNMLELVEDREIWPFIVHDAVSAVAAGNSPEMVGDDLAKLTVAGNRKQTILRDLSGTYTVTPSGDRTIALTLDVEFMGQDEASHLGETVCEWLRANATRNDAPYEIIEIEPNSNSITSMTVGPDGSLVVNAEQAASAASAAGAAAAAPESEGATGAFTAEGGGDGGSNFGGVTGKRQTGTTVNRPGGLIGGAGKNGGFQTERPANSGAGSASGGFARGASTEGAAEKINLDGIAPIPSRPGTYPPGGTVFVGKITFKVKLKGSVAAAAPAAEVQ